MGSPSAVQCSGGSQLVKSSDWYLKMRHQIRNNEVPPTADYQPWPGTDSVSPGVPGVRALLSLQYYHLWGE